MDFETLKNHLGDSWNGVKIYSVENREMMYHETEIHYYMTLEEAITDAEEQWSRLPDQEARDYHEISVHSGELDMSGNQLRFVVQQKHYKAYKKIYVCQDFADRYQSQKAEQYMKEGMSDKDAAAAALVSFKETYTIQPVVRFGMFAGYNYAPALPQ